MEYNQSISESGDDNLSLVRETLRRLGITGREATIYLFLLKKGPHSANSLTKLMRLNKAIVYRILKHLRANGFVLSTMAFPATFSAVPLSVVLDNAAKSRRREAQFLLKDKKLLCDAVKSFEIGDASIVDDEIAILRNRHFALMKGEQLVRQTTNESLVISDGLIKLDYDMVGGLQKDIVPPVKKNQAHFRFIASIDYATLDSAKEMVRKIDLYKEYIKVRHLDLAPALFPRFQICDEKAIMIQFDAWKGLEPNSALGVDRYLWTTNKTIIRLQKMLFDRLWNESIDIRDRIAQLESGQTTNKKSSTDSSLVSIA